jgi:hypothetical protein
MPSFYNDEMTASEYGHREEHGFFGTNAEQHTHFKLQPLLLALCIIIDGPVKNATQQIVHLVSIGIVTSGLSGLISLNGIEDESTRSEIRDGNVVTTTLPAATKFVMEPEMREQRPCLEGRDLTVLDNDLGDSYKQQVCTGA